MSAKAPLWIVLSLAILSFLAGCATVWVANKARRGTEEAARHTETGQRVGVALDLIKGGNPELRDAALNLLLAIESDEKLDAADRAYVQAAYLAALPKVDNEEVKGEPVTYELDQPDPDEGEDE